MYIALFPGSFNPVHNGHIAIARHVLKSTDIDELWFSVSPRNPLKSEGELWPEEHRFNMARLAVHGIPGLKASDYEFYLKRPSYTISTLNKLSASFSKHRFILLIGGDNYASFDRWKEHEEIVGRYGLIVYPRPGFTTDKLELRSNVTVVDDAPLLDISSTKIRSTIRRGEPLSSMLPRPVEEYILQHNPGG